MDANVSDAQLRDQIILARSKLWTPELDKLLRKWKRQIDTRRKAHYEIARVLQRRHYMIGLPATVITTITTTGIFATFQSPISSSTPATNAPTFNVTTNTTTPVSVSSSQIGYDQWVRLGIGILAVGGLTLTGILTFMNYQADAETHKTAADSYDSLYGTIESLLVIPGIVRGDPVTVLQNIRTQYDEIVKKCPNLPKEHQSELSYTTVDQVVKPGNLVSRLSLPRLNPEEIIQPRDEKSARIGADILSNIVNDTQSPLPTARTARGTVGSVANDLSSILNRKNNFDSDDEQEICLGFDLDQMAAMNNTSSALAMAKLAASREKQVQDSLYKALEFEMKRLNEVANPIPFNTELNGSAELPRTNSNDVIIQMEPLTRNETILCMDKI